MAWSAARPMSNRERRVRLDEEVDIYEFPPNKWVQVRYIAPFISYARGWIRQKNPDRKPGGKKYVNFPKLTLDYNPKTQSFDREVCPYRKGGVYMQQRYLGNMIVRDLQEEMPRRLHSPTKTERKRRNMLGERWYCKESGSKTWTPVRCHDMPPTVAEKLANLSELNTRRSSSGKKRTYDISDARNGMDVLVKFNPKAKNPSAVWDVQRAEQTKLSRKELNYLIYDISKLESLQPEDRKTAKREWKRIEPNFIAPERNNNNKKSSSGSRDSDSRRGGRRRDNSRRDKTTRRSDRQGDKNRRRASGGSRKRWDELDNLDDLD